MNLVIVESPNKIKKIQAILDKIGGKWSVAASVGHIRDLPAREMGVEPPNFKPKYEIIPDQTVNGRTYSKAQIVEDLKRKVKGAKTIYLATDPDREGESIAWHLQQELGLKNPLRIKFNTISEKAVIESIKNASQIDGKLVAAQETRRVLDRLCGYMCSNSVSEHCGERASAGRVQSVALRLMVEREQLIRSFKNVNHYGVELLFKDDWTASWNFSSLLPKEEKLWLDKPFAERVSKLRDVEVIDLVNSKLNVSPPAPFTTSTLQQGASVSLNIIPEQTMKLAQNLFAAGHITYHRTDSPNLSDEAIADIQHYCNLKKLPLAPSPRKWKAKESAQEAHEAIRPSHVEMAVLGDTVDERKLYKLIRDRALASQMADAIFDVRTAKLQSIETIDNNKMQFNASGRTLKFSGWKSLTPEDAANEAEAESNNPVPELNKGDKIKAKDGKLQEKKTKPPARFTEASLVKELESNGIGRPATYAAILSNLRNRNYFKTEKKSIVPTPLGEKIISVMVGKFSFMAYEYTCKMEERLDKIAQGKDGYLNVIKEAYDELTKEVTALGKVSQSSNGFTYACPNCNNDMRKVKVSKGKNAGKLFWACKNYPACTKTCNHDEANDKPEGLERRK